MKLFLASEAKHPDTVKELEEFVGGFINKKVAYIPTAANGQGWESWKDGGTWDLVNKIGFDLDLIQLEEINNPEQLTERLMSKDIVWFAGGMLGYLSYWARRVSLDKNIGDVLNKVVFVGSSAGSMLLCNDSKMVTWEFVDKEYGAEYIKPLGVVDFDIYPHYDDHLYDQIKSLYKGKKLYLLKNGEEIIVEDSKITVIGEERIITND